MKRALILSMVIAASPAAAYDAKTSEAIGLYFQSMMNCGEEVVGLTHTQKLNLALMMREAMDTNPKSFERGQHRANKELSRLESCELAKHSAKGLK